MAKASDNAYPSVLIVPGAEPATPATGQRLYLHAADGNKLKRKDSAGVVVVVEGGGGSSAVTAVSKTVHTPPTTPHAKNDEFADLAGQSGPVNGLAAKWTGRNITPATAVLTAETDVLGAGLLLTPAVANVIGFEQAFAPAGDFTLVTRLSDISMTERSMFGIYVIDGAGTGLSLIVDNGDRAYIRNVSNFNQGGTVVATPHNPNWQDGIPVRFILRRRGTVYEADFQSGDAVPTSRFNYVSHTPAAFTVTTLGIGRILGGGITRAAIHYLRVTEP